MTEMVLVAGCGAMGLPMAQALHEAGFNTRGFDVRPSEEFGDFANLMLDAPGPLKPEDILLVVVRDTHQIDQVCFSDDGVFSQSSYPNTLIISSTVSPRYINALPGRLPDNVELIDAPMSGAPYSAEQKSLTFMLGGSDDAIKRTMPLFKSMGKALFHVGATGQGMLAKVLNNYLAANSVLAVRRVLSAAAEHNMDTELFLSIVGKSSGSNWFANNLAQINWARENYSPQNTIGILEKDVLAALDTMYDGNFEQDAAKTTRGNPGQSYDRELLQALRILPDFPPD